MEIHRQNGPIFQDGNVQKRGVKKIYGDGAIDGVVNVPNNPDMVVIEFDEPFDLNPGVIEPACLPTQEIPNDSLCYTSGWGRLGFGKLDCRVSKEGVWLKIFKKEILGREHSHGKTEFIAGKQAQTYLQLPLQQWGAGNVYLLVLFS